MTSFAKPIVPEIRLIGIVIRSIEWFTGPLVKLESHSVLTCAVVSGTVFPDRNVDICGHLWTSFGFSPQLIALEVPTHSRAVDATEAFHARKAAAFNAPPRELQKRPEIEPGNSHCGHQGFEESGKLMEAGVW